MAKPKSVSATSAKTQMQKQIKKQKEEEKNSVKREQAQKVHNEVSTGTRTESIPKLEPPKQTTPNNFIDRFERQNKNYSFVDEGEHFGNTDFAKHKTTDGGYGGRGKTDLSQFSNYENYYNKQLQKDYESGKLSKSDYDYYTSDNKVAESYVNDLMKMYEQTPDYNVIERLFDSDKKKAYDTKQAFTNDYDAFLASRGFVRSDGTVDNNARIRGSVANEAIATLDDMDKAYKSGAFGKYQINPINNISKSGASLAFKPIESIEGVLNKGFNYVTGKPLHNYQNVSDALRSEVSGDIDNKVLQYLYNVGMSAGDMGVAMLSGNPTAAAAILAGEKANDVMNDAIDRGLTPNKIMLEGGASALTTFITEKIPLEIISESGKVAKATLKDAVISTAKQLGASGLSEGAQEILEDLADSIADEIIAGKDSKLSASIKAYAEQGMSYKEAKAKAYQDYAIDTMLDGLGGFLSGSAVSGVNMSVNKARTNVNNEIPTVNDVATNAVNTNQNVVENIPNVNPNTNVDANINVNENVNAIPNVDTNVTENTPAKKSMWADTNPYGGDVNNAQQIVEATRKAEAISDNGNPEAYAKALEELNKFSETFSFADNFLADNIMRLEENIESSIADGDLQSAGNYQAQLDALLNEQNNTELANTETNANNVESLPTVEDATTVDDRPIQSTIFEQNPITQLEPARTNPNVMAESVGNGNTNANTQIGEAIEFPIVPRLAPIDSDVNTDMGYNTDGYKLNSLDITDGDLAEPDIRERGYSESVREKVDIDESVKNEFADNPSLYRQLHNADVLVNADEIFNTHSLDESLSMANSLIDAKNPVGVALANKVSNELVNQGRFDDAVTLTRTLAQAMTEAGQFTQSATLNMLSNNPIAALTYIERSIEEINNEGREKFGKKWKDFELTAEERAKFESIDNGDVSAINEAYADVFSRIAREHPVKLLDKLLEYRRVALLCNMRTISRNLVSNIAMLPTRWTAGRATALAEWIYHHVNPEYVRTENGIGKISKASRELATQVWESQREQLFGDDSVKWTDKNDVYRNAQVFKGTVIDKAIDKVISKAVNAYTLDEMRIKWINNATNGSIENMGKALGIGNIDSVCDLLNGKFAGKEINPSVMETIRNFTYYMLGEFGDTPFVKKNFIQKLSSFVEANNITSVEDIPSDAISLAVQEANKATFHDNSKVAQGLTEIRKGLNKLTPLQLGDFILTFAKTPGNIGARMLEYSPAGLGKAVIDTVKTSKSIKSIETKIADANTDLQNAENISQKREAQNKINELESQRKDAYYKMQQNLTLFGQGFTGSAGIALGLVLRSMGFVVGGLSDDKKEKAYQKNVQGLQENSFRIGNTSYSYDFLIPSASPILFGTVLYEAFEGGNSAFDSLTKSGVAIADAWLDSTPMKNLSDMLGGYGSPAENIFNTIFDIPSSFVPSQVGAIARINDTTVRNASDPTSRANTVKNNIIAKIPWLSNTLPASYDVWGREITRQGSTGEAAVAQLINPGTMTSYRPTEIDGEVQRLGVWPYPVANSYNNVKINNQQQSEIQKEMGSISFELAKTFINSDIYKDLDDESKKKGLQEMYDMAKNIAVSKVLGTDEPESELYDLYKSGNTKDFVDNVAVKSAISSNDLPNSDFVMSYYEQNGIDGLTQLGQLNKEARDIAEEFGRKSVKSAELETYVTDGADALKDLYKYQNKTAELELPQNKLTRELYNEGEGRLEKYKRALTIANEYGADKITEDQWKTYDKIGEHAFRKDIETTSALKEYGIDNTEFSRGYYEKYGDYGLKMLDEADDVIKSIESGVDKYGDAKYLNVKEATVNVYKEQGVPGLENFSKVLNTDQNNDGSVKMEDKIPTLRGINASDSDKGFLLEQTLSSYAQGAVQAKEDKGYGGFYQYYLIKYSAKSGKQEDIIAYIDSLNISKSEKKYWFNTFFPKSHSKPFG